jgi:hypothetical protein
MAQKTAGGTPERERRSAGSWVALALAACVAVLLLSRLPIELRGGAVSAPTASTSASSAATVGSAAPTIICQPVPSTKALRVGQVAAKPEEDAAPALFAVEIGGATTHAGGFAVALKRAIDGGATAEVLLLGERGQSLGVVSLGRLRADVGPPIIAAAGAHILAAVLEPNASGMARRVVAIRDGKAHWGAEIALSRAESFGADMLVGKDETLLVYDDVQGDDPRSRILLSRVASRDAKAVALPRVLSRDAIDAETPRLLKRDGGYWLVYVARLVAGQAEPKGEAGQRATGRYAAESIEPSRIEVLRLDESGAPVGEARPVTPVAGHVLAYDVRTAADGGLRIAWRDDDTPSGSSGGELNVVLVDTSGAGERERVTDEDIGAGAPQWIGSWLAFASGGDLLRLARVDGHGRLETPPIQAPTLGRAQLLVARGDDLLMAQPEGAGIALRLTRCQLSR